MASLYGVGEGVLFGATLAPAEPLTALPRSARSRVSSSRSLWKAAYGNPLRLPSRSNVVPVITVALLVAVSGSIVRSSLSLRAGATVTMRGSVPSGARLARVPRGTERALAGHEARTPAAQMRRCSADLCRGGEGVLGGAPAERAHRLGAITRPNGGRSRTLPRRGHLHRPLAKMQSKHAQFLARTGRKS